MAKSVEVIQKRIAKLQTQIDAIKAKEAVGVIGRIREAVVHYGLTVEHIFGSKSGKSSPAKKTKAAGKGAATKARPVRRSPNKGAKAPIKFRDDSGNEWSGRGSQPRWLRATLESGKKLEDFSVKS